MDIMSMVITFVVIWKVAMFLVLPIGIKMPDNVVTGHADSAPAKHYIGIKLALTCILSIVLTVIYWFPDISI